MPESAQKLLDELTAAGLLSAAEITKFDREIAVGVDALLKRLIQEHVITQYQADKFLAGQLSDIYFGDYIVLEELGRGGMGTVLLARHRRMEREVAIKILPVTTLESESAVARFYQEVKVAAKLTHPNIVHAYDAGEHHGFHYLVMEYVRGHDLAKVLEQLGTIPVHLALDYITQTAQGLDYAHRKGVVHRDIKPSNLLLDDEGAVKILDMGLARIGRGPAAGLEASMHLTTTGQVMGTVEYMSPEQAEDTRAADARSDIYSLGCTFFRLITGQSPFSRDTVVKTILAHREAPIPLIAEDLDPIAPQLNPLFQRMVAKNPEHRFQNAGQLLNELRRFSDRLDLSNPQPKTHPAFESSDHAVGDWPTVSPYQQRPEISYPSEPTRAHPTGRSLEHTTDAVYHSASSGSHPNQSGPHHLVHPTIVPRSDVNIPQRLSDPAYVGVKLHRGNMILTLGILSFLTLACGVGVILGIVTWVYANSDLKEMESGLRDVSGKNLTVAGKVIAMITVGIAGLTLLASIIGSIAN